MKTTPIPFECAAQVCRLVIAAADSIDWSEMRRRLLSEADPPYEIFEANLGAEAIQIMLTVQGEEACCLVLDESLPDMDVLEVLAALRKAGGICDFPVVVLGDAASAERFETLLRAGAQEYIERDLANPWAIHRAIKKAVQRWNLQRELRERDEHLRLAMGAAMAVAYEWDIRRDRVRRLQSVETSLPSTDNAWDTFEGVVRVVYPEDQALFRANVHAALASDSGDYCSAFRIVRPDGMVRWLGEKGRVDFDTDHQPVRLIGISYDITERKRAEESNQRSDRLLKTLMESTPDLIWAKDCEGRIILGNQAMFRLLGDGDSSRVIGFNARQLIADPEQACRVEENDARVLVNGFPEMVEESFGAADDLQVFQSVKAPLYDGDGAIVGLVGVSRDVTTFKRIERNLEFLEDLTAVFARVASAEEILSIAHEMISQHFGVSRVNFSDVNVSQDEVTLLSSQRAAGLKDDRITRRLSEYLSNEFILELKAGRTMAVDDVTTDPRTAPRADAYAQWDIGSMMLAPYVSEGRWKFLLVVHKKVPCHWSDDQISLLHEVANRVHLRMERARAEMAVRARERELQSIADNSPNILARFDRDLRHTFINAAIERATGRPREAFLGKTNRELGMPAKLCKRWDTAIKSVFETGQPMALEYTFVGPNGPRDYLTKLVPEFGVVGAVEFVLAVSHDLTHERKADLAVRASEERLARAQQAGKIGTWDWDLTTNQSIWTDQAWQIFEPQGAGSGGRSNREKWLSCVHTEDRVGAEQALNRALIEGHYHHEYRVVRPAGQSDCWVESMGTVEYLDGRPVRMVGTVRDITERKRFEQTLQESDRQKDEFLAMLAHELRNPLAPIRNSLQILRSGSPDLSIVEGAHDMIDRQVTHLVRLVDDLLDVSRVSRGKIQLQKVSIDLRSIVRQAVDTSQTMMASRRHKLSLRLPEEPIRIEGDATRLIQVVGNLLNNAAKYTEEGGFIEVTLEHDVQGEAVIRIRDNGRGIDPAVLTKLFDLFYQADRTIDRSEGGLGIGLSLVKKLVEMHGGRVEVLSAGVGKGSEFLIHLPLFVPKTAVPDTAKHDSAPSTCALRILVVDDNRDSVESMAMLLQLKGHEVFTAYDGQAAVEVALAERPDVVLLDIGLPLLNGYEACCAMRAGGLTQSLIVAMTGYGQEDDLQLSKQAGFDDHQLKPFEFSVLQSLLAAFASSRLPS